MQAKDNDLRKRYGISLEDFQRMIESQNGCCAICKQPFGDETPHVDHNHATNEVRGLLHSRCNSRLGVVEDAEFCKQAQLYLEKYGS